MNSAVCFSLVANLRCSGLQTQQAIAILVPPTVEAFLVSFLIYAQWNKGRKHLLLVFDSYIFLALCIVDFVSKTSDAIYTSMMVFSVLDRVIGGLSGFPIVLYTLFLYLFARQHFISVLPTRLQWSFKVLLILLIPVILILVELGSLLGFSYMTLPGTSELAVRYDTPLSKTMWTLLNSAGLALLILYQFICFCLAVYRVFRYFNHATSSGSPRIVAADEKGPSTDQRDMRMRGVGWITAGIKLGAIEVLLGFVPNGFEMALTRRLLRLVARLMLAWGVYQGIDESSGAAMFRVGSIDSIEGLPPRRIPVNQSGGLRTLISAPMAETFAKMSPTATAFHTRKKVPEAISVLRKFNASFVDEKGGRTGNAAIIPALVVQDTLAPPLSSTGAPYGFGRSSLLGTASNASGGNNSIGGKVYPERPTFPKLRQDEKRVTLAYDGLQAPVLDIRFSTQVFPDAGGLISRIGRHSAGSTSSGEEGGSQRSPLVRSHTSLATTISSRSTQLERTAEEEIDTSQIGIALTTVETSQIATPAAAAKELLIMSRTTNSGKGGRSRSTLYNPFTDPPNLSQSSSSHETSSKSILIRREDSSLSEDSLTAIRQLSRQFPPLPSGSHPSPAGEYPSPSISKKTIPDDRSGSAISERTIRVRQRSYSPHLRSPGGNTPGTEEQLPSPHRARDLSPRASLDQDVATRTKRRIHAHLKNASSSAGELAEAQWWVRSQTVSSVRSGRLASSSPNTNTATSTATSLFSARVRAPQGVHTKSPSIGRAESVDDLTSPTTVFTDSVSSDDVLSPPPPTDRSVGRIARRAFGIEQFLEEEKEKKEASQDGHSELRPSSSLVQSRSTANVRFEDHISQLPVPSTSRVRPRPNLDTIMVAPQPPKRSMTVEDPDARQAFAAAWRTVVPTIGSPSVGDLKTVNSVLVKRTPAPSRHQTVFSGESMQSMRVDEVHSGLLSPVAASTRSQRAIAGSGTGQSRDPTKSDRELVRKARSTKAASVESEVY